ncbi:mRNA export factor isoform X2 [Fukomys damarensis]|uniref:mRNA export factor isoform X2 n=1 Tax=Fukomys damarensis TaxID=885580 RepID=UPI00053F5EB3|nr:mRNA export factor isoform X2 [Fukomys damarensis]
MSLFGTTSGFGTGGTSMFGSTTTDNHNPMKDIEVTSSPDDSIGCLSFSPPTLPGNFLIAGSWANDVRCWEVQDSGQTIPKAQQMHTGPVLDVCWSDDGSKVFTASCDKTAKMWDLNSNQAIQIAQHDAPVKTIHWIKAPNYSCVMTGSWDKTLKFWDTRSSNPMMVLQLPERCYCADVIYPMAVVATAERGLIVYQLENQPSEFRRIESPLKHQHRCVAIFKDKQNKPTGFALGSIEGRVAIHYINPPNPAKDNFTFKCHRSNGTNTSAPQDIYAPTSHHTGKWNRLPPCSRHPRDCGLRRQIQLLGQRCPDKAENVRAAGPADIRVLLQSQWQHIRLCVELRLVQGT